MKTIIAILISITLIVGFSISAESQDHEMVDGHDRPTNEVMGDYHARSMMMDQIVEDPEMRQEMIHKIKQSMDMQQMMNDPEMKTRMQKHVGMMQSMLDSEEFDQTMMDNPEMMSMMKMHMMCAQTASDGIMGEHSMKHGEEHMQ